MADPVLPSRAKVLLGMLSQTNGHWRTSKSQNVLAELLGCNAQTIARSVAQLVEIDRVRVTQGRFDGWKQHPHSYTVLQHPEELRECMMVSPYIARVVDPTAACVAAVLRSKAGNGAWAQISYPDIARAIGESARTVGRAVHRLLSAGIIRIKDESRDGKVAIYVFALHAGIADDLRPGRTVNDLVRDYADRAYTHANREGAPANREGAPANHEGAHVNGEGAPTTGDSNLPVPLLSPAGSPPVPLLAPVGLRPPSANSGTIDPLSGAEPIPPCELDRTHERATAVANAGAAPRRVATAEKLAVLEALWLRLAGDSKPWDEGAKAIARRMLTEDPDTLERDVEHYITTWAPAHRNVPTVRYFVAVRGQIGAEVTGKLKPLAKRGSRAEVLASGEYDAKAAKKYPRIG